MSSFVAVQLALWHANSKQAFNFGIERGIQKSSIGPR
jgi:hypothetical protein